MRRYLVLAGCLFTLLYAGSCDSDSTGNCPVGYHWDDLTGQCEQDTSEPDNEKDIDIVKDDPLVEDADDIVTDEILPDADSYTGSCLYAVEGGSITFDVKIHALTIGAITVGGAADDTLVAGELWAENDDTKDEFKVADLTPALTGETFGLAEGTYNFFYRGAKANAADPSHTAVPMQEKVIIAAAKTLDIDLPLYELSGSVTKNGAAYPALTGTDATDTKLTIQSGTYSFEIPYSEFASFSRVMPKGNYTVSFTGRLAAGAPLFTGKALFGATAIALTGDTSAPIDLLTTTVSGTATVDGAAVDAGVLAIVKDPPLEPISVALIPDLSATKDYNVEVLSNTGITYVVVYLASLADYPYSFQKLVEWADLTPKTTGAVSLDFGLVQGTISLKTPGGPFPALTACTAAEAQCFRGRLKALSFSGGTVILKNLGVSGDDYTYEGLLVRRQKICDDDACANPTYTPRAFSLSFESYFNDIEGMTNYLPFSTKVAINGAETFQFTDGGGQFTDELTLDPVIAPVAVSGTVTFNGAAAAAAAGDMLFVRDVETQTETPVINLKDLAGGAYTFAVPAGSYHVVYKGGFYLGYEQRAVIDTDLTAAAADITAKTLDIGTAKIALGITVNGESLADYLTAHPEIDHYDLSAANDKNTIGSAVIPVVEAQPDPYIQVLKSPSWDLYLNLYVKEGSESSVFRSLVAQLVNVSTDTTAEKELAVVAFTGDLTANGAAVTGAATARGFIEISGDTRAKVFFPASGTQAARFLLSPGEYGTPNPQLTLDGGFDLMQKITAPCIFVEQ
ncbi:MAG TPA: hypothetical protein PLV42_09530 [bacterium]|nr:hypothetical protein [bacterium]